MIDLQSKADIDKISLDLLKQSKSIDIFPTPVDNLVKFANLHFENGLDLTQIDPSFLSQFSDIVSQKFISALGLVRGFLDRREKTIYLDLNQNANRQNFIKLHEVGHDILPWQKDILDYLDDDDTLNPYTKEEFEAEANYFASTTLFQHDRFEHEMSKLELGIKTPMYLAKQFGASKHAALRKYIECNKNRCALLVLEKSVPSGGLISCSKRDYFQSNKFTETFGNIDLPETFGYTWAFTKDYVFGKRFHEAGKITLQTQNGQNEFYYHFFNNTYNAFVFMFPIGEKNKVRTKILIKGI
ncbi:MAG: ImmA/IrrE family metallo-endopeptidase [Prolixibacteraceae bacterium]|nr:ImmA/IrrE family metallo-endopeptidase [Prolixibacteraceae bacterium]